MIRSNSRIGDEMRNKPKRESIKVGDLPEIIGKLTHSKTTYYI